VTTRATRTPSSRSLFGAVRLEMTEVTGIARSSRCQLRECDMRRW
jgi:hypothetical protein